MNNKYSNFKEQVNFFPTNQCEALNTNNKQENYIGIPYILQYLYICLRTSRNSRNLPLNLNFVAISLHPYTETCKTDGN